MPIRGHSGVQGGAEVGCVPGIDATTRETWTRAWGFAPPATRGYTAADMVDASARGEIDLFWIVGGNFRETLADEARTREALARPALRVHQDIVLSSAMLVEPSDTVLLLPATTRYESPGGGTETTTERRIVFSPEIPGRRVGSARPEWEVFRDAMARAFPDRAAASCVSRCGRRARRDRASRAALCGNRDARRQGRCRAVGRRAALRGWPLRHGRRQRGVLRACRSRIDGSPTIASTSRPAAGNSSTPWCSATSIRSPARGATTCS